MGISKYSLRRSALVTATALAAIAAGWSSPARAQAGAAQAYHLVPGKLADALRTVSRVSGTDVIFTAEAVKGLRAPPLDGTFTPEEAITRLIAGTELQIETRDGTVLLRGRSTPSVEGADGTTESSEVLVTGSRIKGAKGSSPVTILTSEAIRTAGYKDLGEAVRALPQNFSGGQNPGVVFSAGGNNQNLTSGSSLNLRGLGPDASLTLLNGHRFAYDGATQAIDISSIPLAAVDRIEIVADGASALYGSDAVGGVANVLLKSDYEGLDALARFGAATNGGLVQQQYSGVAGTRWQSGGVLGALTYEHSTEVSARERSLTKAVPGDTTLYPSMKYLGAVATVNQRVGDHITLDADAFYSQRISFFNAAYTLASYMSDGSGVRTDTTTFGISPRASVTLPGGWRAEVRGTYSQENVDLLTSYFISEALYAHYPTTYTNSLKIIESSAEGALARLPGGNLRLAVGGGYRSIGLAGRAGTVPAVGPASVQRVFDDSRDAYFAYGEILLPLVSPSMGISGVSSLSITAAGRYENYLSTGSVFTPKFGAVYSPIASIDLKGSWGESFKAPTLYQTSIPSSAILTRASGYGSGYPVAAAVLLTDGGNPALKPERATTWTAGIALHPKVLDGVKLEISYFNIQYRDRIVTPISPSSQALINPLYRDLVTLSPSQAQIDAVVNRAALGLVNNTSFPFSYGNVVAIVDNRFRNVSRFSADGVDVSASVGIDLKQSGHLSLSGSASYLNSSQQATPGAMTVARAGTIFNPPHWRWQLGAVWETGPVTLAPTVNRIGGLDDARTNVIVPVAGMTTFDLTLRYRLPATGPLTGVETLVSALNLLDDKPAKITVPVYYYPGYDSSNYSAIGRSMSITVRKTW